MNCLVRLPKQTRRLLPQIQELFHSQDEYVRAEAAALLVALDPDSNAKALAHLVYLIELLSSPVDPDDKETSKELLAERNRRFGESVQSLRQVLISVVCTNDKLAERLIPKLIEWYRDPDGTWEVRHEALEPCFQRLGPKAKAVGPMLIENIHEFGIPDVIGALGPEMVPLLVEEAKRTKDPWEKLKYLARVAKFGEHALPALPVFQEILNSSDSHNKVRAIEHLALLQSLSEKVYPELIKRLRDDQCIVRAAAASGLGTFANHRDLIIPELMSALQDDYADVRAAAVESLIKLDPQLKQVRNALQLATKDRHLYVRLLLNEALQAK